MERAAAALNGRDDRLLLFDDATPDSVEGLLPVRGGRVVVTSRDPHWATGGVALEVGLFAPHAAAVFLDPGEGGPLEAAVGLAEQCASRSPTDTPLTPWTTTGSADLRRPKQTSTLGAAVVHIGLDEALRNKTHCRSHGDAERRTSIHCKGYCGLKVHSSAIELAARRPRVPAWFLAAEAISPYGSSGSFTQAENTGTPRHGSGPPADTNAATAYR